MFPDPTPVTFWEEENYARTVQDIRVSAEAADCPLCIYLNDAIQYTYWLESYMALDGHSCIFSSMSFQLCQHEHEYDPEANFRLLVKETSGTSSMQRTWLLMAFIVAVNDMIQMICDVLWNSLATLPMNAVLSFSQSHCLTVLRTMRNADKSVFRRVHIRSLVGKENYHTLGSGTLANGWLYFMPIEVGDDVEESGEYLPFCKGLLLGLVRESRGHKTYRQLDQLSTYELKSLLSRELWQRIKNLSSLFRCF